MKAYQTTANRHMDGFRTGRLVSSIFGIRHSPFFLLALLAGSTRRAAYLFCCTVLLAETVMTLDWIAERLQMGCRHTLANCLKGQRIYQ